MIKAETDNLENLNESKNYYYYFILFIFTSFFAYGNTKFVIKSKVLKKFKFKILFKILRIPKILKTVRITKSKIVFIIFVSVFTVNTQIKRKIYI